MRKNITTSAPHCIIQRIFVCSLLLFFVSCEGLIDIEPPATQIVNESVFTSSETATSALVGIYSEMLSTDDIFSGGRSSVGVLTGLSSDEFIDRSSSIEQSYFFNNTLVPTSTTVQNNLWGKGFKIIYYANAVLEGLSNSSGVDESTKRRLEGEAKFIRAFANFYLLNLFGEIPLITTTAYQNNKAATRAQLTTIYDHITNDLESAIDLLPIDYSVSSGERIRPNRFAAMALLSRVSLFDKDWVAAETYATMVIENSASYSLLPNLNDVFVKNNKEALWQLVNVNNRNTWEGETYIPVQNTINSVTLRKDLIDAFEPNDKRRTNWVASFESGGNTNFFAFKYKNKFTVTPVTEYSTVLRLSEQYLIRSEARAHQDKLLEAIADVDKVRERAGLPLIQMTNPFITKADLLSTILEERRKEFFAEWGHRWLDLKRTGMTESLKPLKLDWQSTDALYPIPQSERIVNPNLTQNDGY